MLSDETYTLPSPSPNPSDSHFNRLLPYEIKQEIFSWACYKTRMECEGDIDLEETHEGEKPYILLTACKEWRHIITNTPTLWRLFKLRSVPEDSYSYMSELIHKRFDVYMKMSKRIPFYISVKLSFDCWFRDYEDNLLAMLHQMKHVTNRLKYLKISFRSAHIQPTVLKAIQDIMKCDLPILKTAKLWWTDSHLTTDENRTIMEFGDCPQLRHLVLTRPMSYTPGTVGWSNITELVISFVPMSACLIALKHSPNLYYLQCNHYLWKLSSQSPLEHAVVSNSSLKRLTINHPCGRAISRLLEQMRCPSLHTLALYADWRPYGNVVGEAMERFLNVSRCPLRTLKLYGTTVSEESLMSILDYTQTTIKTLHLRRYALHLNKHFPAFVQKLESASYLPQLGELCFATPIGVPVDFASVLQVLQARQQLETFIMQLKGDSYELDEDVELGFHGLNETGRSIGICSIVTVNGDEYLEAYV